MENKDIIYNKTDDLITPIDTSARDLTFEADAAEKAKRALLEEQQAMYQDIEEPHKHR